MYLRWVIMPSTNWENRLYFYTLSISLDYLVSIFDNYINIFRIDRALKVLSSGNRNTKVIISISYCIRIIYYALTRYTQ